MKQQNRFFKDRIKRENHDGWQRTHSHLDHAAGEYEPFLSTHNLFSQESPKSTLPNGKPSKIIDGSPQQPVIPLLETVYGLKIIPWQGQAY